MGISPQKQMDEAAAILLGAGYVLFFCVAAVVGIFLYAFYYASPTISTPLSPIAANLPPRTPTPHISFTEISGAKVIFEDDFTNNKNRWTNLDHEQAGVDIRSGKLSLESQLQGSYEATKCAACPYLEQPYYLEVDLATDLAIDEYFGITFNVGRIDSAFYLIEINTQSRDYRFLRHSGGGWALRLADESNQIRPFPEVNTLGIYPYGDTVEIYVNGKIINSYTETGASFHEGYFGLYTNDAGFKVLMDNLIVREAGNE